MNFLVATGTLTQLPETKEPFTLAVTPDCIAPVALLQPTFNAQNAICEKLCIVDTLRPSALSFVLFAMAEEEGSRDITVYTNDPGTKDAFFNLTFFKDGQKYSANAVLLEEKNLPDSKAKGGEGKKPVKRTRRSISTVNKAAGEKDNTGTVKKAVRKRKDTDGKKVEGGNGVTNEPVTADEPQSTADIQPTEQRPTGLPPICPSNVLQGWPEEIRHVAINAAKDSSDKTIGLPTVLSTRCAAGGIGDYYSVLLKELQVHYDEIKAYYSDDEDEDLPFA